MAVVAGDIPVFLNDPVIENGLAENLFLRHSQEYTAPRFQASLECFVIQTVNTIA